MKRSSLWCLWGALVAVAAVSLSLGYWLGQRMRPVMATVAAQTAPLRPQRERPCSVSLVQGGYALNAGGVLNTGGEYVSVGLVTFDGVGAVNFRLTQSFHGRIVPPSPVLGAYAVNADCTGRIALNSGALFDIVVADEMREVHLIQINADAVLRGVARKI